MVRLDFQTRLAVVARCADDMGQNESKPSSAAGRRRSSQAQLPPVEFAGDFSHSLADHHTKPVLCCDFSPDEKLLVTGSADHSAIVWSLATGMPVTKFMGHADHVTGCAFAGLSLIVTASLDGRACVWQVKTGTITYRYSNHEGPVFGCRVSHDGNFVATCSEDKSVHIWLVEGHSGPPKSLLRGHTEAVLDCQFSPDDVTVATCGKDKTIRLWNRRSGKIITQVQDPLGPQRLRFSPDGIYLCVASNDSMVRIWNMNSEAVANSLAGHSDMVTACDFNTSGSLMASSSKDKTVRIWNPRDIGGAATKTLSGHRAALVSCIFSPSGRYLATTSLDNTARVWK